MDDSRGQDITPKDSGQGLVFKKIIEEGPADDKPHYNDDVYFHYVGRVVGQDEVFDSSRERGSPFKLKLGHENVLKGWEVVLPTMNVGEKALVTFYSKFAYGSKGADLSCGVPADATVEFDVELVSYCGEDLTKEKTGAVIKNLLKSGLGFVTPRNNANITLELKCWHGERLIEDEKHEFVFSKSGGGENPRLITKGALLALCTMREKELARVVVQPSHGFGDTGCADLDIPADATLKYELRLVTLRNKKQVYEMTYEERMDGASKVKAEGTEYFKASEFTSALKCYKRGVELTEGESVFKGDGNQQDMSQLRLLCLLNCAACNLKLKMWSEAKESCTQALAISADNVKALYRRAEACLGMQTPGDSIGDLQRVLELDPGNKSARQRLHQAEDMKKDMLNKERNLYSSIFARMAEDKEDGSDGSPPANLFQEAQARLEAEKAALLAKEEQAEAEAAEAEAAAAAARSVDAAS